MRDLNILVFAQHAFTNNLKEHEIVFHSTKLVTFVMCYKESLSRLWKFQTLNLNKGLELLKSIRTVAEFNNKGRHIRV